MKFYLIHTNLKFHSNQGKFASSFEYYIFKVICVKVEENHNLVKLKYSINEIII